MVSPLPMETHLSRDISKLCSKFTWQLDGNMQNDQWAAGSTVALPLLPPTLCQRLPLKVLPTSFALFQSHVPFFLLTTCLVRSATVTGKWATVSNLTNLLYLPLTPCCHLRLFSLLRSLCPATVSGSPTVSWDTLSSLTLTRGKLSLLKILTFPLSLGSAVASFSSPFC